jgi:hypothetical protein
MFKSSSLCFNSSNLGTFWLKIKQFWPFEEISIFSNGGHLGWRAGLSDTILKGTPQEKRVDEILIVHCCFSISQNELMARSSLAYIPGFSVKFFFQPIYTDYANWAYFDKRSHSNLLL